MSKILYVCSRRHSLGEDVKTTLFKICNELVPDNIRKTPKHKVCVKENIAYAVTMRNSTLHESEMSVLLGILYAEPEINWDTVKENYPDGNYAIFRNSQNVIEVVTDMAGSRTIWYYHDKELFLASSSQRAIILFLKSFSFDERVIPWLLSTGSLGPYLSWDKRLYRLQANSSVLLDKKKWTLYVNRMPVSFSEVERKKIEYKELLTNNIKKTIKHLETLDWDHWRLPLSGGYDSRAILCFIKNQIGTLNDLKTVTWGVKSSLIQNYTDAKIAIEVARSAGAQHKYYFTDISSEPIDTIVDRFILCGEGRIDHIAGYLDGMEIWRQFHDEGIEGVIRGDEGFGWQKVVSGEMSVRRSVGLLLCNDYENIASIIETFKLPSQKLPFEFQRYQNESLSTWRDRLYHLYRIPTILAALSDIKYSYVELINPLLSKAILNVVRSMPDTLRTDKRLFKEIVETVGPNISFARMGANADLKSILSHENFLNFLQREISSPYAVQLFGEGFVNYICSRIIKPEGHWSLKNFHFKKLLNPLVSRKMTRFIRRKTRKVKIGNNILAFRVYIILKMHKILNSDAFVLKC